MKQTVLDSLHVKTMSVRKGDTGICSPWRLGLRVKIF